MEGTDGAQRPKAASTGEGRHLHISPGVPPKHAMLRTSYMATHEKKHLDRGLEAFEKVGRKYGVIS